MKNKISIDLLILTILLKIIALVLYYNWSNILASCIYFIILLIYLFRIKICSESIINPKNVFTLIFHSGIALSMIQLHQLQENWNIFTFLVLEVSYYSFLIGFDIKTYRKYKISHSIKDNNLKKVSNIIFWVSLISFIVEVILCRGNIPLFSDNMSSYREFGISGLHYFTCSISLYPTFAIILLYKKKVKKKINIFLKVIISFIIPILIVSRQLMIMELLLVIIIYVFYNKKKQLNIILKGFIIIIFFWFFIGQFRNQDETYIKYSLQIQDNPPISVKNMNLYMYFAFNYDNFDYNIKHLEKKSLGYKSFFPLFALTGTKKIVEKYLDVEPQRKIITYTTFPIQNVPYTDFGIVGVIIYMFIIGKFSKMIMIKTKDGNEINIILYSMIIYALLLAFFTSFFSNPTFVFDMIYLYLLKKEVSLNEKNSCINVHI